MTRPRSATNSRRLKGMTAEKLFEARWVATLVKAALGRLRSEFRSEDNEQLFEALKHFLFGEEDASYQQVADRFDLSVGALKTKIHRMRSRYRALVRDEVARTVATPDEVEEELRCLRVALSS
jgi:DNA-directed RNA polymerase specialized sigma24 family protein